MMLLAHDTRDHESTTKRTADVITDCQVTFDTMLLAPRTLQGLLAAGFVKPSPVQLQGIPSGKCGFNLLLEAKSGTGKTAVFTVIALDMLDIQPEAQIMILAPTREIAAQITDVIRQIGSAYEDLQVEVVMGGLSINDDISKFANKRKVQVIVGSPGRLRHLIEEGYINTASVRLFVLDEADKLMEGLFKPDINYIFSSLPNCKQVIMSSATYPESLRDLIVKYMAKYIHIRPNSTSVLLGIEQRTTVVEHHTNIVKQTQLRYEELIKIFKSRQFKQCLVFCNYQARTIEVCKKLNADKWPAQFLHGQQQQTDRLDALKTLQEYKCRILVTTDLAARGIDASNVDMVINFEVPYEWTTYLHRIGRAGRYGSYGLAITITVEGKEEANFKKLLSSLGGAVNIKTLWTEEPVKLTNVNGDAELEIKQTHEDKTKETAEPICKKGLWDVINNSDDRNDTNDDDEPQAIEDFDDLAASYNEADGIEIFGDLLSSYEQNNERKSDSVFRVLEVNCRTDTYKAFSNLGSADFKVNEQKMKSEKTTHVTNGDLRNLNGLAEVKATKKTKNSTCANKKTVATENVSKAFDKYYNYNNNLYLNNANINPNNVLPDNIEKDNLNDKHFINSSHIKRNSKKQDQNKKTMDDTAGSSQYPMSQTELDEPNGQMGVYPHVAWTPAQNPAKDNLNEKHFINSSHIKRNSKKQDQNKKTMDDTAVSSQYPMSQTELDEPNGQMGVYPHVAWTPAARIQRTGKYEVGSHEDDSSSDESVCSESSSSPKDSSEDEDAHWDQNYTNRPIPQNLAYLQAAAKNYNIWKKQLAARSAQIQMAVYIKEMAKLT